MQKLGQKIREYRLKRGLTQENLAPDGKNNSLISHIENGTTKNPSEITLKSIAKALDLTFDELVDETDYQPISVRTIRDGLAISPADFTVHFYKTGIIKINRKVYPYFDINGNENKYCPVTGVPLITSCRNCNRQIDDSSSDYCMSCGYRIMLPWHNFFINDFQDHILPAPITPDIWTNIKDNRKMQNQFNSSYIDNYFNIELFEDYRDLSDKDIERYVKENYNLENSDFEWHNMISATKEWTGIEWRKGFLSKIPEIVQEHTRFKMFVTFRLECLKELRKIEQEIIDKNDLKDEVSANIISEDNQ